MKRLIAIAAFLVVIVNVWIFASVLYNRYANEPQYLTLHERELRLSGPVSSEQSLLQLTLQWQGNKTTDGIAAYSRHTALSPVSFQGLGFPQHNCEQKHNNRYLSKVVEGWVLLEFNGDAYRDLLLSYQETIAQLEQRLAQNPDEKLSNKLERLEKNQQWARNTGSRLVAVDAAVKRSDLQTLARSYHAKTLIFPATITAEHCQQHSVNIEFNNSPNLYVPSAERDVVQSLKPTYGWRNNNPPNSSRFSAQVGVGAKGYWWLEQLHSCPTGCD